MLPHASRTVLAVYPVAEWSWDKETQSRILAKLDFILVTLQNAFQGKKGSPIQPDEQWQPDYVKEAKEEAKKQKEKRLTDEELEALKRFWRARNHNAKFIGDDDGGKRNEVLA